MNTVDTSETHPPFDALCRLVDGDLAPTEAEAVRAHVAGCFDCSVQVGEMRASDEELRSIPVPPIAPDLLERVLRRRAMLEAGSLSPSRTQRVGRRDQVRLGLAAALVVAGVGITLVLPSGEATAEAGVLTVGPLGTEAGTVSVAFTPSSRLRAEGALRLRSWSWAGDPLAGAVPTLTEGVLARVGDRFEGALPGDLGDFSLVAIESLDGEIVDVNGGAFWSVPTRDASNRSAASYVAELRALQIAGDRGLSVWDGMLLVAEEGARSFPRSAAIWFLKSGIELRLASGEQAVADLTRAHRQKVAELADGTVVDANELAVLVRYAGSVGEVETRDRLLQRLADLEPNHPVVSSERMWSTISERADNLPALLRALETEWSERRVRTPLLTRTAFSFARTAETPEVAVLWADRALETAESPAARRSILRSAAQTDGMSTWAGSKLPAEIEALERAPEGERALHQSRSEYETWVAQEGARLRVAVGETLIAEGQVEEGARIVSEALLADWDLDLAIASSAGLPPGSSDAEVIGALVRADPLMGSSVGAEEEARERLRGIIEHMGTTGSISEREVRLSGTGSEVIELDPTTVSLTLIARPWSRRVDAESEDFSQLVSRLSEAGIPVRAVVPSADLRAASEDLRAVGVDAFEEVEGSATRAFRAWYARQYVVVRDGRFWAYQELQDAVRMALLSVDSN